MVSAAENETLTRVGPSTPCGELMRRYWHPITGSSHLRRKKVVPIRLLGEDLVLYRDLRGQIGLIDHLCAHRRVDLSTGYPVENGLRCAIPERMLVQHRAIEKLLRLGIARCLEMHLAEFRIVALPRRRLRQNNDRGE